MTNYNDPYNNTYKDEYKHPATGRRFHLNDHTGKAVWLEPPPKPGSEPPPPKKKRKVFLWFFLVVQALFLAWVVSGVSRRGGTINCDSLSASECAAARNAGEGVGIGLLVLTWIAADVVLGLTYALYRLTHR
jgi:hypothetical protein